METADDIAALREQVTNLRLENATRGEEIKTLRRDLDKFQANVQWLWRTLIFAGTPGLFSVVYMTLTTKGII